VGRIPLTTRLLFEVMLESKIDPSIRSQVNLAELRNRVGYTVTKPARFENHKGRGTQSQKQNPESKSKTIKIKGPDRRGLGYTVI
jgi:hypothetical protein